MVYGSDYIGINKDNLIGFQGQFQGGVQGMVINVVGKIKFIICRMYLVIFFCFLGMGKEMLGVIFF